MVANKMWFLLGSCFIGYIYIWILYRIKSISVLIWRCKLVERGKKIMSGKIKYARLRIDGEEDQIICCEDLEKDEYERKYKGKLNCIKGCNVRIKFTERKNNIKFFSTWNKEGHLHEEWCPYHVDYKGKIGRERLKAYYESVQLDDDIILERLKSKARNLNREYSYNDITHPENGTREVEMIGEGNVRVYEEDGSADSSDENKYLPRIRYEEAQYISVDDIGCRKGVIGDIDNVQLNEDSYGRKFAYFNLITEYVRVNIAFPEAFYSNEYLDDVDKFEEYIIKIKNKVEESEHNIPVIAYGEITKKKKDKNGVNVSVISPKRILVDGKTFDQIMYEDL